MGGKGEQEVIRQKKMLGIFVQKIQVCILTNFHHFIKFSLGKFDEYLDKSELFFHTLLNQISMQYKYFSSQVQKIFRVLST